MYGNHSVCIVEQNIWLNFLLLLYLGKKVIFLTSGCFKASPMWGEGGRGGGIVQAWTYYTFLSVLNHKTCVHIFNVINVFSNILISIIVSSVFTLLASQEYEILELCSKFELCSYMSKQFSSMYGTKYASQNILI